MFYLFLADGFEEIEALATVDILRRGGVDILTVGTSGDEIEGAHGIRIKADISIDLVEPDKMEGMILPGGIPGTPNLEKNDKVQALLDFSMQNGLWICAICAAPSILGKKGFLNGKKATCYPGFEETLTGAKIGEGVCVDGNIITGQGAGKSLDFAFAILDALGKNADELRKGMLYA